MPPSSARLPLPRLAQLRQQWLLQPLPEPENSVPLRVTVQALVTVGIIATDIAAADSSDFLGISLWAVPASLVGASWSWWRRRKRNIPMKFCIAIAMLVALGLFLARLVAERNDTRLALAELLIQLQVFHSFDLPRRKDLGYSAVIGLILLGVAATLSQTLAFAPLLLLFLAIAIPVMVLDYRSRLGLVSSNFRQVKTDLSIRRLGRFLLLILALGLTVFLLLPRLPGYQIRSFPVSAPIDAGKFESNAIINPGYARGGEGDTGFGGSNGQIGNQAGGINKDYYYGFNSQMNQNLRGAMQPKVVMRVRSQAAGFWRVLAFDRYTGQGWQISRNEPNQVQTLDRPTWIFRFNLPWSLTRNRTREVVQSYTLVSNFPNLIPALAQAKELYFPTRQVAIDPEGGLRSPVQLSDGLTYTVVSEVPYRDRTLLQQAPTAIPLSIRDYYLQVPDPIRDQVRQLTETMLAKSPKPLTANYEKALYLAQSLKQKYSLQPDLPILKPDEDLVTAFLSRFQGGYPDHFSTVLTVMLRSIDIPARLAVGFAPGRFNPFTGYYIVQNTDAYALTEVYFPRYGWFAFDPIPGHELLPPSIEDSATFSVLRQFWNWVAGWLPSPVTGWINALFEQLANGLSWLVGGFIALFARGWLGWLLGLGVLTLLGFLGWLSWSGWQAWRYRRWLANLPPVEAIYQQMLRYLAEQGHRKPAAQTPLEYVQQIQREQPDRAASVEAIARAYLRWRYGGYEADLSDLRQQLRRLKQMRTAHKKIPASAAGKSSV